MAETLDFLVGVEDEWEDNIPDIIGNFQKFGKIFSCAQRREYVAASLKNLSFNAPKLRAMTKRLQIVPTCRTPTIDELKKPIAAFYSRNGKPESDHFFAVHNDACTAKRMMARLRRKFSKDETPRETYLCFQHFN